MTKGTAISLEELSDRLRSCKEAQRVEAQDRYSVDQADFGRTPPEVGWWSEFLAEIARLHAEGQQRTRINVLPDPLNDYWQWRQLTNQWHVRAGEDFWYLNRARALAQLLPVDHDWWIIDGKSIVQLWFADGALDHMTLITEPITVGIYHGAWNLALREATQAAQITAA